MWAGLAIGFGCFAAFSGTVVGSTIINVMEPGSDWLLMLVNLLSTSAPSLYSLVIMATGAAVGALLDRGRSGVLPVAAFGIDAIVGGLGGWSVGAKYFQPREFAFLVAFALGLTGALMGLAVPLYRRRRRQSGGER